MKCISKKLVRAFGERPVFAGFVSYVGEGNDLLLHRYGFVDGSDTYDNFGECLSRDNGQTWSDWVPRQNSVPVEGGRLRWIENAAFYDQQDDTLYSFTAKRIYLDGEKHLSRTGWSVEICRYNPAEDSWDVLEETTAGLPNLVISFCRPIRTTKGSLLVPALTKPMNPDGTPVTHPRSGNFQEEALVMIGRNDAEGILSFRASQTVKADPERVSRGLAEPMIAELTDGRIAMITRGSNAGMEDEVPGYKWVCFSEDDGQTWSAPEPLMYTDGGPVESGANGGSLFRSETDGRVFWIGNPAVDAPAKANFPRNFLAIFEVQETPFALKRDTMTVIDRSDINAFPKTNYSNFRFYQERPSGDILLYMSDFGARDNDNWRLANYYRYRIQL